MLFFATNEPKTPIQEYDFKLNHNFKSQIMLQTEPTPKIFSILL